MTVRIPPTRGLILVAEGNKDYARSLKGALDAASADPDDVVLLPDGNQVKKYFHPRQDALPRVLLVDLWLPHWPGLEILKWIRDQELFHSLPVVVMSTGADSGLRRRAAGLGANSFLVKSYSDRALARQMSVLAAYWRGVNLAPAET